MIPKQSTPVFNTSQPAPALFTSPSLASLTASCRRSASSSLLIALHLLRIISGRDALAQSATPRRCAPLYTNSPPPQLPAMDQPFTNIPLPPSLQHRMANDMYDRPQTPTSNPFCSPNLTPQGSPSKHQVPPGSTDLPNVFDNALRLQPTVGAPSRIARPVQSSPTSPSKHTYGDHGSEGSGSPTRKGNKENSPPRPALQQKESYLTHAAASRQEPYRAVNRADSIGKNVQWGLSPEDREKLQKPAVRRLANVTQLCKLARNTNTVHS